MASIHLQGTLVDTLGEIDVGAILTWTHLTATGEVIPTTKVDLIIPPNGFYSIDVEYGQIRIDYRTRNTERFIAEVVVNQDSTATSIPELLNAAVPVTDPVILQMQDLLSDTEAAKDLAEAAAVQLTTQDLIGSTAIYGPSQVVTTSGFSSNGDNRSGSWIQNGVTAQTPNQTPAQLGDALLNDGNGNQWSLVKDESTSIATLGGVGDDLTDNSLVKDAFISTYGYLKVPNGVFRINEIVSSVAGVSILIVGESREKSILKSNNATGTNVISLFGGGVVVRNITIDQNRSTQTGGHCIRSGGCSELSLESVTLTNASGYGIGIQGGTSKRIKISDVLIINVGKDGIDVKDYNLDNEVMQIDNLTVIDYGIDTAGQSAVDIRGPIVITNLVAIPNNPDSRAFRLRESSVQGREGSGSATGIYFNSNSASSYAIQISENVRNYSVTGVEAINCGLIGVFGIGCGGYVSGLSGENLQGDALSIFGDGVTIDGLTVNGAASRGVDFESGANNNTITNFRFDSITSAEFARIQGGTNNKLINGYVQAGKGVNGGENTGTVISNITNYKTSERVLSPSLLIDSTGLKVVTIPHTLDVTPNPEDIGLTIYNENSGNNYQLGFFQVGAITSTDVQVLTRVNLAAVPSSTIKFSCKINARNS